MQTRDQQSGSPCGKPGNMYLAEATAAYRISRAGCFFAHHVSLNSANVLRTFSLSSNDKLL